MPQPTTTPTRKGRTRRPVPADSGPPRPIPGDTGPVVPLWQAPALLAGSHTNGVRP